MSEAAAAAALANQAIESAIGADREEAVRHFRDRHLLGVQLEQLGRGLAFQLRAAAVEPGRELGGGLCGTKR